MIQITPNICIHEQEIQLDFTRSSGPGGQNVNKVSSAVHLRYDINRSTLPQGVRLRLIRLAGKKISGNGILNIDARRFRTQTHNREDAIARLIDLIKKACVKPKTRQKTRPTLASKKRTLRVQYFRKKIKNQRKPVDSINDQD